MTPDDFKRLLDEALEPIKETQKEHTKILKTHSEVLETLQASVVTIENTINAYGDMYKINNRNAKKLEKRIEVLEDKSGITPPPEFTLTDAA